MSKTTRKPAAAAPENADPETLKSAPQKTRLIRDSFTFPENDHALIAALRLRALQAGREVKKSEVLRAGLVALIAMTEPELLATLGQVSRIKTGRPGK